ncbi:MAG: diguanylate cyclase [Gemmatimonadaceae bacterium]
MTIPYRSTNPVASPAVGDLPAYPPSARHALGPRLASAAAGVIGVIVLAGWALNVAALRSVGSANAAAMNPAAALCFVALAAALWCLAAREPGSTEWQVARTLAALVGVVGALRLVGALAGHPVGIDTILFHDAMRATLDGRDNRMALAPAVNFLFLSVALLLVARRESGSEALAQVLATLVLACAQLAMLAFAYRSGWFDTIGHFNRMAVPTAIAFTLTAIGVLALRPRSGVLAVALSDGPGGAMARGLLPAGFVAPAVFGWVAIWGLRASDRQDQPALVVMLFVVAMILVFVGLIAWNATQVHRTHLEREQTEAALRDSELRFRLLAENGSDVVSLHDPSGRVVYISPSCERVLGFAPDEVMRMSPFALAHPDDRDRLRRHFDDLLRGAPVAALSCRMLHKTGQHLWLEMMWRAIVDEDGRVSRLQASSRDVTERKDYERQLEETRRKLQVHQESLLEANARLAALASHDALTGLKNRRAFEERMVEELARIRRTGQPVTLLLLDIDHFKSFNDSFGHPRGDVVLRDVARLLSRAIRDTDIAARYGGEEFAIVLPNTGIEGAYEMGERLRRTIEEAPWAERSITISVGAATADHLGADLAELLEQADRALYRSKQGGRNCVTLAEAA